MHKAEGNWILGECHTRIFNGDLYSHNPKEFNMLAHIREEKEIRVALYVIKYAKNLQMYWNLVQRYIPK
jgi:hypothetical protein